MESLQELVSSLQEFEGKLQEVLELQKERELSPDELDLIEEYTREVLFFSREVKLQEEEEKQRVEEERKNACVNEINECLNYWGNTEPRLPCEDETFNKWHTILFTYIVSDGIYLPVEEQWNESNLNQMKIEYEETIKIRKNTLD